VDDDSSPVDDDDSPTPDDDDSPTPDDDESPTDDDDSPPADDDDSPPPDDDDSATPGDDDDGSPTPDPDDLDGDGFDSLSSGGEDCDDGNASVYPGAPEDPGNSTDDDCDGDVDEGIVAETVFPDDGLQGGGSIVTISGTGFSGIDSVTFGGAGGLDLFVSGQTSLQVVAPAGLAVGDVDVVVSSPLQSVTVAAGFRYTGTASTLDIALLVAPETASIQLGDDSGSISGVVTEPGVTDSEGEPSTAILAEVGYGPFDWSPDDVPDSWFWFPAAWSADSGSGDQYDGVFTPLDYGTYSVGFRFSDDGGFQWKYADFDPETPLDPLEMTQLDVTP
jgi:hypothetical protein